MADIRIVKNNNDLDAYLHLLVDAFTKNEPSKKQWFRNKITCSQNNITIGLFEENILVAGFTIYHAKFILDHNTIIGGQIGDAVVHPSCRGKKYFSQLLDFCKNGGVEKQFDFLFSFPSDSNLGSYKTFQHSGWTEIQRMFILKRLVQRNLLIRILRKISVTILNRLEDLIIKKYSDKSLEVKNAEGKAIIDQTYFDSKNKFSKIFIFQNTLISVEKHEFIVDFIENLKPSIDQIYKLAYKLGKDSIRFYSNDPIKWSSLVGFKIVEGRSIRVMLYPLNSNLNFDKIEFRASDFDTF